MENSILSTLCHCLTFLNRWDDKRYSYIVSEDGECRKKALIINGNARIMFLEHIL